ncbi:hypothetical protein GCM10007205_00880 [Oxalicibacterium flavum]|uniref:TonB C-terminal domain-containing protein n=2 Tax=Oxalicibacterium flavum TaxID=179467 RepID=A0A8J2UKM3_9BURK|nr:hypothetical protein GCM10007205_00880 [Oxalicibacterium flavum]
MLGIVGLGLSVSSSPAQAQAPAAQPVPQHWISYAQMASNQFEAWLGNPDDESVQRLHAWMQERLLQDGPPVPTSLVVRVWVEPNGRVGRMEFASLGQNQADADLRSIMTAQPLSEPPPPDMRLPMVLQLSLKMVTSS